MGCNCRGGSGGSKRTTTVKYGSQGKPAKPSLSLSRLITKKPVRQPNYKSK